MRERMGSGGPRGLQILLSVADRGRGGFDSHTFPPFSFRALVAGWVALSVLSSAPGVARAQALADSAVVAPATPSAQRPAFRMATGGERPRPWHQQPWSVMTRSALLPGWGQFKNRRPLKAGIAIALEGVAGARLVRAWRELDEASQQEAQALAQGDVAGAEAARAEYDRAFNRRSAAGWILGLGVVLSMVDAYVDAHLIQFDADFGPDPALPDDVTGVRAGGPGTRLSLRWSFTGP